MIAVERVTEHSGERIALRGVSLVVEEGTKAMCKGVVIAESNDVELVEGNVYFPPNAVQRQFLRPTQSHTVCGWKGECSCFDVVVGDKVNTDAAWVYKDPKPAVAHVRGRIAFWRGLKVER